MDIYFFPDFHTHQPTQKKIGLTVSKFYKDGTIDALFIESFPQTRDALNSHTFISNKNDYFSFLTENFPVFGAEDDDLYDFHLSLIKKQNLVSSSYTSREYPLVIELAPF